MRYKNVLSIVLAILFIIPLVANVASLVPIVQAAQGAKGMISTQQDYVYPGSTFLVTVNVPIVASVTITVSNAVTGQQYVAQSFYAPMPGEYTINVQIPKVLSNIGTADPPTLLVKATIPLVGSDNVTVAVYPLIEVNPTASTIVDGLGNSRTVTITGYGFPEGASVTAVNFNGLSGQGNYTYVGSWSADSNGVVGPITIDLKNLTGYGIPAGSYNVTFTSTATGIVNASIPVFTVIPQLVILDNYGNGRDVEQIRVEGYGFPAYANITQIDLYNTNFTNVSYSFPVNTSTDSNGYLAQIDLKQFFKTNMSAGLYVPIVYLSDNTSYTFRNTYHLVRPILCYVINGAVECDKPAPIKLPGETATIVAYGYGPGSEWGYRDNVLYVSFDKMVWLTNVTLGKDGNATFQITVPNATYGSHYIWGRDSWSYEYSLAVIIGGRAYWVGLRGLDKVQLDTTNVSAGYPVNNMPTVIVACPCGQNITGYGYCAECVVYGGECDYLGDYIRVVVTGLNPGESFTVYFGNTSNPVASGVADSSGYGVVEFVVPTLPEGSYNITVVGEQSGSILVPWFYNPAIYNATIVPKILALSLSGDYLPVIVGSGIVRFIGTGFRPGVSVAGLLVNGTDALLAVTTHVFRWSADDRGVLTGYAGTTPAVWIPMMHPGKYELTLAYFVGTETYKSKPTYVYVVNNISKLITVDDLNTAVNALTQMLNSISAQINGVSSAITTLDGKLTSMSDAVNNVASAVATVSSRIDAVSNKLDSLASNVNAVSTKADSISGELDSVLSRLDSILTALNSIGFNASTTQPSTIEGKIDSIATELNNIGNKLNGVSDKLDSVSNKIDAMTSTLSRRLEDTSSNLSSVNNKIDAIESMAIIAINKASSATSTARNTFLTGLIATVFSLLATVFALLAYTTVKRSIAPK